MMDRKIYPSQIREVKFSKSILRDANYGHKHSFIDCLCNLQTEVTVRTENIVSRVVKVQLC